MEAGTGAGEAGEQGAASAMEQVGGMEARPCQHHHQKIAARQGIGSVDLGHFRSQ